MMVWTAINYDFFASSPIKWFTIGSLLFYFSDSVIAYNKFVGPVPFEPFLILGAYYPAQFCIVAGAIACSDKRIF